MLLLLLEMTKTRDNPPEYYPATRIVCRGREDDQKLCFCIPSKEEFLELVATEKVHTTEEKEHGRKDKAKNKTKERISERIHSTWRPRRVRLSTQRGSP